MIARTDMKLEADDFPDGVLDAIADRVAERLRGVLAPAPSVDRFVSRAEARRLGIERRALVAAERSGELAAYRPGKATVYRESELRDWIQRHRVEPKPEATADVVELPSDPFERARALARSRSVRKGVSPGRALREEPA
jgi:hypothetical protein